MADYKSVSAGGNATSDAHTMQTDSVSAAIQIKAKNDGTPASGDTITAYILETLGDLDVDPDSADEYTNPETAVPVATLDTNDADPAISQVIGVPGELKGLKVYAENNSGGRAITVSAQIVEIDKDGTKNTTQITWT